MRDTRERPVCHRAEDLVSYLYGEASASDAFDFRDHLQHCDACRSEFAVFNQVHDSIQIWRNEALGASFDPAPNTEPAIATPPSVRHERKLSALAALREFFTVAPLWLRGATGFAALLLFVLAALLFVRVPQKQIRTAGNGEPEKLYTENQLQDKINKAVEKTRADLAARAASPEPKDSSPVKVNTPEDRRKSPKQTQVAVNQPKMVRSLNRQELAQLAADLRLTPLADEDDSLIAMPQQEIPDR